jgi:hypothetical protein
MIVGVGYAALSDVMDVAGTTSYDSDKALDALVYFSNVEKSHTENNIQIVTGNVDKASFNVASLATIGDHTFFWITVTNDSAVDAQIAFRQYSGNDDAEYYSLGYCFDKGQSNNELDYIPVELKEKFDTNPSKHEKFTLKAGQSTILGIMVELKGEKQADESFKMPDGVISATFNFEITVEADANTPNL